VTEPPADLPAATPPPSYSWAKAIGILSVSFGGLSVLCGFGAMITQGLFKDSLAMRYPAAKSSSGSQPVSIPAEVLTPPDWARHGQLADQLIAILAAGLLLAGGICLLRRRRVGRSLHLAYMAVQVVAVCVGAYFTIAYSRYLEEAALSHASVAAEATVRRMYQIRRNVAVSVSLVFGLAYPVFLLIWFLRPKIRRDMAAWG
jgi:hypothetical protein